MFLDELVNLYEDFTEKNITFSYKVTDQLKNTVSGSFNGPYYDKNL